VRGAKCDFSKNKPEHEILVCLRQKQIALPFIPE